MNTVKIMGRTVEVISSDYMYHDFKMFTRAENLLETSCVFRLGSKFIYLKEASDMELELLLSIPSFNVEKIKNKILFKHFLNDNFPELLTTGIKFISEYLNKTPIETYTMIINDSKLYMLSYKENCGDMVNKIRVNIFNKYEMINDGINKNKYLETIK